MTLDFCEFTMKSPTEERNNSTMSKELLDEEVCVLIVE